MENMICGLIGILALACLAYSVYRFLAKDEITTCFGEHYRWRDAGEEENRRRLEDDNPKCPLE
jgi:uncharacterized membrane protein YdjX (TVP38/TMEM64 family)